MHSERSDFSHGAFGEPSAMDFLSPDSALGSYPISLWVSFGMSVATVSEAPGITSLGVTVSDVICTCSEEEVMGLDTSRFVAVMENVEVLGDGAVFEFPCEPVR